VTATFLLSEQKEQLTKLRELITNIESCGLLGDIDPVYCYTQKQEYIQQYAVQINRMAQTILPANYRFATQ